MTGSVIEAIAGFPSPLEGEGGAQRRMRGRRHIRDGRDNPSSVSAVGRSTFSLKGRRRLPTANVGSDL